MEQLLPWLLQLGGGAVGGNLAGSLFKNLSLGTLGNSIAGILGGGLGGQLLSMLGILNGTEGGLDLAGILATLASSATGGGGIMAIIGLLKSVMGGGKGE